MSDIRKVLLDCDPGIDDALAIALAIGDPAIDLRAITTVGGNVGLQLTTENALRLREYFNADVPISAGSAAPLIRNVEDASHVHGVGGLGGAVLPASTLPVDPRHAAQLIIDTLRNAPGEVHVVAIGPLTNIALAIRLEPRVVEWAASFVMMGGSFTRGNATPAAEFNVFADPEAARIVFGAGWQVTMIGLDVTHQARANSDVIARLAAMGDLGTELVVPALTFYEDAASADGQGPAVHDLCAVAYISHPEFFTAVPAAVDVETSGRLSYGMTVVDFDPPLPNANVPTGIDKPAFWDYVVASYATHFTATGRVGQ
ncbi:nucleoside hydrolase [Saxibacter everestensis]|uniref:Nucleoside hydrolase n=1 Tax=Saxibacter everestensis TaxID=2909229 RepID=A0ABY8QPV5_9MICO|nr:nucleoside hydrolase [Brevibacteriaceae bacterium ZFBP1038]